MDPPDAGHVRNLRIANQRCSENSAGNDPIKTAGKLDEALVAPHRVATTEFGEHLVSGGEQRVHNERNIGIEKSFSQWSIYRRHHCDKNSIRPAPLRQVRKDNRRTAQAQLVRDEQNIPRPASGCGISGGKHPNRRWRIVVEPIAHVVGEERIAAGEVRPSLQKEDGALIGAIGLFLLFCPD